MAGAFGELRDLYPDVEPYDTGMMKVSDLHTIYFEQSGNPAGKPIVFVHGGPGGGTAPKNRRFFNPAVYRIVMFDQRGCGKSVPYANLEDNTTWSLIADMERLRAHLAIAKWVVFGGSWGSTLALAYAETHPTRVTALILRGIFLLRKVEIDWFYEEGGASAVFPDYWEDFVAPIPVAERGDMVGAYHARLTSADAETRLTAAKTWSVWEGRTSKLFPDAELIEKFGGDEYSLAFARIENHYFVNRGFFETDDWLLTHVDRIRSIPAVIVQGRYDMVCPIMSAWALHRAWPEAELKIVPDAGHNANEPGNQTELLNACDKFARL